jgi:hypothetical protein
MPAGVRIQNGADVQHSYTAADKNNANHVVFTGNLDSGANSPRFDLVADANGKGHVSVAQAGEIGVDIFEVVDNAVLVIKEQTDQ